MKIERYALKNFGIWGEVVYEPGDARLCIIGGENGTGKSTLVSEALGYALYRDFRGSINGPVRNGQTDCSVSIELSLDGHRYRAIRRRTTKGAGKSSADLQVQNGAGWIPVAEGDREVPAEVRSLLHMDAPTFRTSVSLAQNDLRRFVDATAGDRKEILAAIVVDPRFKPAAELASKRARDLEATIVADRAQLERLDDTLASRSDAEATLAGHRDELAETEAENLKQAAAYTELDERIRSIDAELAAADGLAGQIADVERERSDHADRWRRVAERKLAAERTITDAERLLVDAPVIERAVADLPAKRARVDELVAAEAADRAAAVEIEAKRVELEQASAAHADAAATWRATYAAARARVDELAAAAATLEPVICEQCGHLNVVDQAGIRPALAEAQRAFAELEKAEPKVPVGLARQRVMLDRLVIRRREAGSDPNALVIAHRDLSGHEAIAARSEALEAARATIERERAAIVDADVEQATITEAGSATTARLAALREQQAAAEPIRAERSRLAGELAALRSAIEQLERSRRIGEQLVARDEAAIEQLDAAQAEHDEIAGRVAETDVVIGRLRYLAGRCGLKGIPARVIESVLPELGRYANDVLGELFGLRLELRATRVRADGKATVEALDLVVAKDGIGEVELERASGGQGTAIALALAIGLARLNARRAGMAIRSMVVDEPEGLDVRRLKALGAYLRDLLGRGELDRVFLITHTTELAEFGDRVDEVREGPDGAYLTQVA